MSPVVGVMLMLVVTIIIAAVVSAFGGGMMKGSDSTPSLSMDIEVTNTGSWIGSGFSAKVLGVSAPISTKDVKIVTSWSKVNESGKTIVGGASVVAGVTKNYTAASGVFGAPYGFGNGVATQSATAPYDPSQYFGNYTLEAGTTMLASPWGAAENDPDAVGSATGSHQSSDGYGVSTLYVNTGDSSRHDAAESVLGDDWEVLRSGDAVKVTVLYLPTGKVMFEKNVRVTG